MLFFPYVVTREDEVVDVGEEVVDLGLRLTIAPLIGGHKEVVVRVLFGWEKIEDRFQGKAH